MSNDIIYLGVSILLSYGTIQVYDTFLEFSLRKARRMSKSEKPVPSERLVRVG